MATVKNGPHLPLTDRTREVRVPTSTFHNTSLICSSFLSHMSPVARICRRLTVCSKFCALLSSLAPYSTLVGLVQGKILFSQRLPSRLNLDNGADLSEQQCCDVPDLIVSDQWQGSFGQLNTRSTVKSSLHGQGEGSLSGVHTSLRHTKCTLCHGDGCGPCGHPSLIYLLHSIQLTTGYSLVCVPWLLWQLRSSSLSEAWPYPVSALAGPFWGTCLPCS